MDLNPGLVIVKELEILGCLCHRQGRAEREVSDSLPLSEAARAHDRLGKEMAGRLVLEPVH